MVNVAKGESEYQDMDLGEIQELVKYCHLETLAEEQLNEDECFRTNASYEEDTLEVSENRITIT